MKTLLCCLLLVLLPSCVTPSKQARPTGPWNLDQLKLAPAATWGQRSGLAQAVWYEGEPWQGKPTRVFAYYARPESGAGPFPAMLLVHGGGGKAFKDWAEHWARRGYVALALDTAGHGPDGRLPDGGPDQSDKDKFRPFTAADASDMWTYHAVAAAIRGHSLLAAQPEVDRHRIGITGISWGGYLTCIIAGLDDRLKVAAPVYGCGFLDQNSCWKENSFDRMAPEQRARWVQYFDPSQYLRGVSCPILFLNGSNDFAYPLDSYRKSYELVQPHLRHLSVKVRMKHGHIWTFTEVDHFVDSVLSRGQPLARLKPLKVQNGDATTTAVSQVPLSKAELHYTTDSGPWQKREWKTVAADFRRGKVLAPLPTQRPLVCYLSVTDEHGDEVSTPHVELGGSLPLSRVWEGIITAQAAK